MIYHIDFSTETVKVRFMTLSVPQLSISSNSMETAFVKTVPTNKEHPSKTDKILFFISPSF